MPDEARQPSMMIDMVPIHTELLSFERWEKGLDIMVPFCSYAERHLF